MFIITVAKIPGIFQQILKHKVKIICNQHVLCMASIYIYSKEPFKILTVSLLPVQF